MRRIAPLIAGALAILGPIGAASGRAQAPTPAPAANPAAPATSPVQAPAPSAGQAPTPAPAPATAEDRPAPYDPAVQRAGAPTPAAPAQDPAPATAEPTAVDDSELDAILGRWEQTSGKIETLYATFEQVDEMAIVDQKTTYKGSAYLRRPGSVVLQLEKQVEAEDGGEGGEATFVFDRRIVANGDEVIEFDGPLRQITIFPMPRDARQRALEEGPLPFLFRMNVSEFKQRYRATLMPPNQEGAHRIAVYPRHPVDRDAFAVAVLILDERSLQPRSIHTLAPNGKDKQNYVIKDLRANVEIKPELFAWGPEQAQKAQQEGWRIVRNPAPDQVEVGQQPAGDRQELAPLPR